MLVITLEEGYAPPKRDGVKNFHGNQLVYINWEKHMLFSSALAFPFPPAMPFGAIIAEVLPQMYGEHPDFEKIDWAAVRWKLDGEDFTPDPEKSLADQGIGHKSLLRFWTPGLNGLNGNGI